MVVTCPECGTQYAFPETRLKAGGVKLRCSRCRHVFRLTPPESPSELEGEPAKSPPPDPVPEPETPPAVAVGPEPHLETEAQTPPFPEGSETSGPAAVSELPSKIKWPKWVGIGLLILALAAGLAGLAWWNHRSFMGGLATHLRGWWQSRFPSPTATYADKPERPGEVQEVNPPPPPMPPTELKDLPITWAKARYRGLVNAKGGQLLVIQGEVVNRGKTPRGPIRIKAVLTDARHRPLREELAYSGTTFSDQELKSLNPGEIQDWLTKPGGRSRVPILTPGQTQAFTVVFFGVPDNLAETQSGFQVVVVEGPKTPSSP
uniref:DUF3426 domain-containing protein n=1 Tax=Desulfobacca acetoxidans TaxID=60893 RepID=A0A7C5EMY9_9BACT